MYVCALHSILEGRFSFCRPYFRLFPFSVAICLAPFIILLLIYSFAPRDHHHHRHLTDFEEELVLNFSCHTKGMDVKREDECNGESERLFNRPAAAGVKCGGYMYWIYMASTAASTPHYKRACLDRGMKKGGEHQLHWQGQAGSFLILNLFEFVWILFSSPGIEITVARPGFPLFFSLMHALWKSCQRIRAFISLVVQLLRRRRRIFKFVVWNILMHAWAASVFGLCLLHTFNRVRFIGSRGKNLNKSLISIPSAALSVKGYFWFAFG